MGLGRGEAGLQFHGLFFFDGGCEHVEEDGAFGGLWGTGRLVYLLREVSIARCMGPLQDRSRVGARAGRRQRSIEMISQCSKDGTGQ